MPTSGRNNVHRWECFPLSVERLQGQHEDLNSVSVTWNQMRKKATKNSYVLSLY